MQNSLDFSKTIGGNVARFVKEAIPYSNWGMTYFNIRLMELALIESPLDGPITRGGSRALEFGCGLGLCIGIFVFILRGS